MKAQGTTRLQKSGSPCGIFSETSCQRPGKVKDIKQLSIVVSTVSIGVKVNRREERTRLYKQQKLGETPLKVPCL